MRRIIAGAICCYQRTISPDHGVFMRWMFPHGFCRYFPTCSEYGRRALMKHGTFIGSMKAMWRIIRCNPWSKGGVDEP